MSPVQRSFSGAPWEKRVAYCRAVRAGKLIWVSGTAPVTDDGSVFAPGDPLAQTRRCLEIVRKHIEALGGTMANVVRTRMYVTDIQQWQAVAEAHRECFAENPPACTMVEVKALIDPAMLIEIEADAIVD